MEETNKKNCTIPKTIMETIIKCHTNINQENKQTNQTKNKQKKRPAVKKILRVST
jgi:hypothetical protein|tara:strand:- start:916 stop:1080 length:165 start_codon:yes stop_codon:yes gene_type:complete